MFKTFCAIAAVLLLAGAGLVNGKPIWRNHLV